MNNKSILCIIIAITLVLTSYILFACDERKANDEEKIFFLEKEYNIVIGEKQQLIMNTSDVAVTSNMNDIVAVRDNYIEGIRQGKAKITARKGDAISEVYVNVYDRMVSHEYASTEMRIHNRQLPTVNMAVKVADAGDKIYIREGKYDENIEVDKDLYLLGEEKCIMSSISVGNSAKLMIRNIGFVMNDSIDVGTANIEVKSGAALEVINSQFVAKRGKEDNAKNKQYAIYVHQNSVLVNIEESSFEGYNIAINIDSTDGRINIINNNFLRLHNGVFLDIVDHSHNGIANMNTTGQIASNIFEDVDFDIEFLYAGSSYNGKLIINRQDKVDSNSWK